MPPRINHKFRILVLKHPTLMSSEGRFNYYSRIWLNISEWSLSRISYHMLLTQLNSATDSYRWLAKINGRNTLEFEFLKDHVQEPNINYKGNRGMDLLRCLHNLCTHAFDSVEVNNKRVYVYLDAFPWLRNATFIDLPITHFFPKFTGDVHATAMKLKIRH